MGNPEGGPSANDGDHDLYQPQVEVEHELQADQQFQYQQVSETTSHDQNQQDQYQQPPPQPPNNAPQNNYDPQAQAQAQPQGVFQQLPPSQPQPVGFPPPQGPPQQNPYQTPTPQPAQFPPQGPQQFAPQNPQFQNQQQEANYQQPRPVQFPPQPQTLTTAFVPCLTFGQIAEVVDNGRSSCATSGLFYGLIAAFIGIPFIMSCTYRTKLRSKYNLIESPAPDWVIHLLCEPCALCQEYRELQVRGIDPSIGWIGNVQRNPSLQQPNVNMMMPPMNQNMNQY
ncbi:hypothetical protein C1H46_028840 [Malus baccata]|uniref:Uncharacterized protein n=1 Tax=Malus baccata TaxID=106549 RepID=A0A540LGR7_MALBA|nr:hypothetical protein C1H46_028840 [Malus baccata]